MKLNAPKEFVKWVFKNAYKMIDLCIDEGSGQRVYAGSVDRNPNPFASATMVQMPEQFREKCFENVFNYF